MKNLSITGKFLLAASFMISLSSFAAEEYKGTVVPLTTENYSTTTNAYDRGWILTLARLGQIFQPDVVNEKGDVVSIGSALIYGDPATWKCYLDAYVNQFKYTTENKKLTYIVYEMFKKLVEKNARSQQDFTRARSAYEGAAGQYDNTKCLIEQTQITVDRMTTRPVFEGMVKTVKQASGSDVGNAIALEVVQLNPIGINIPIPMDKQLKITTATPIKIYVNGIEKPFGCSRIFFGVSSEGYIVSTGNYQIIGKNTILENNGTPILREWVPVSNFNFTSASSDVLGVPPAAILKDDKGSFVWRAKGQKVMDTDKGIDYKFPLEKVYIQQGESIRYQTGYNQLVSLKDKGTLAKNELILNYPPENLQDAQEVIYPQNAYLLMPGDEVRVVIGDGPITNSGESKN
ncbi:MAG TPA: hypothetical protein DD381_04670 [Lentisphaeria bacterium]|nr:MAG: hypothetical protein A2X47_11820 [Lentisphaerae bacterium GWF2_38_69]HBM15624.1 hypothetical protein [Lentisphaeria bacterium]